MNEDFRREAVQKALRRREELEAVLEVVCACDHRRRRHQMNLATMSLDCLDCEDCPGFGAVGARGLHPAHGAGTDGRAGHGEDLAPGS